MPESIEVDIRKAMASLTDIQKRQIPYALSRALNDMAKDVVRAEYKELADSIDRPTPFTMKNSGREATIQYDASSKRQDIIQARVFVNPTQARYLSPLVYGGPRAQKRWESVWMSRMFGGTPFAMPARDFKTDRYGNIPGSTISAIISKLGLNPYTIKYTKSKRVAGSAFFAVGNKQGSKGAMGIYQRIGKKVRPVAFMSFRSPQYKQGHFDFYYVARKTVERTFDKHFTQALNDALATANRPTVEAPAWFKEIYRG
jgi:hypothetical protein